MVLTDESIMPFGMYGKHKLNKEMANVPADYLLWIYNQNAGKKPFGEEAKAVQRYILDNLDAIKLEAAKND